MGAFTVMTHQSITEKKAHEEKINERKAAKYFMLLQHGSKASIPLDVQLKRFKSTLKR